MSDNLPKFNKPPVIETILGVDFDPISDFQAPYYGLFLLEVKDTYKNFVELPPIDSQVERFEGDSVPIASFRFGYRPDIRCLFLDKTEKWRLQVQNNKFLSNWAKSLTTSKYPNYELTSNKFKTNWNKFLTFLKKNNLNTPVVQQCEVSYLNHIEFGNIRNLSEIFPFWNQQSKSNDFLPEAEATSARMIYRIPNNRGRLRVDITPNIRHIDSKKIISLSLTAKVFPKSSGIKDVVEAMNIGHEWVVRGFTDLTSDKMHKIWERR